MVWGVGGVEMPSSRYSRHSLQSAACTTPPLHCIHITRIKHHLIDFIEHAWAALLETIFIWPEKLYLWFSLKPQCYNLHRNGCPFTINRTKSNHQAKWWLMVAALPLFATSSVSWIVISHFLASPLRLCRGQCRECRVGTWSPDQRWRLTSLVRVLPMVRVQAPH